MATQTICIDLWDTIISYVQVVDLRTLSRSSPLFDEKIRKAGHRLFYKKRRVYRIDPTDTIIKTSNNGKFLLRKDKYTYTDKTNGQTCSSTIDIECTKQYKYHNNHTIHVDHVNRITMAVSIGKLIFIQGITNRVGSKSLTITNKIIDGIDFIDLRSKLIVEIRDNDAAIDSFIVFSDKWYK